MSITKKNVNLDKDNVRNMIFKFLGKHHVDNSLAYEMINDVKDIDSIKDGEYIMCPRFNGTRSWVIFLYDNNTNVYYAVNFPKHNIRKREEINIYPTNVSAGKSVYLGTIMEGIYYQENGIKYIIIDEVYMYAGEDQTLKTKSDRLGLLNWHSNKIANSGGHMYIYTSKYYEINRDSLISLYETIKSDPRIQEITFYPNNSGKKIYSYAITKEDLIDHVINIETFIMEKTSSADVYNMLIPDTKKKTGVAYIPDIQTSKKCKQWFTSNKAKKLLVKFQKDFSSDKWIPIEMIEKITK